MSFKLLLMGFEWDLVGFHGIRSGGGTFSWDFSSGDVGNPRTISGPSSGNSGLRNMNGI